MTKGHDVPGRDHYGHNYDAKWRFASYWHQVDECMQLGGRTCLVIGAGSGVVPFLLRRRGFEVAVLDVQPELDVDLIGDVRALPCDAGAFDVVLCSQVLEHLPFDQFDGCLRELGRAAKRGVVLSLPDRGRCLKLDVLLDPRVRKKLVIDLPRLRGIDWQFDGQHHWEVNTVGYEKRVVEDRIRRAGFSIESAYRVVENPYHHFWRLTPSAR